MEFMFDTSPPHRLILGVISSMFFWFAYYNILCLKSPSRSYEWHCRVVTLTHAVIITGMSFVFGVYFNPWLFTDPGGPNTVYEVLTLMLCLGYFLFDFGWCLWFWGQESHLMLLHHVLSIVAMVVSLSWGISGTEVNAAIFGSEISNPLLQFRWFMRETGHSGTWYYEVNDFLFVATFFFCRTCLGTYLLYTHYFNPKPTKFFRMGGMGMYLVSWCFMIGIFRFAFYKYSKMYRNWKKKSAIVNGNTIPQNGVNGTSKVGVKQRKLVSNGDLGTTSG
ncbi:putative transmembrane protein [Apostichopus japonicus]|uniref:Putative transmembrane protein n=1 Tax=Stichopus japonicus TaxID=307972 RepID=A0A2G8LLB4_STIJA|nr:putative transmembrane protein [Apostichopus japonicus]